MAHVVGKLTVANATVDSWNLNTAKTNGTLTISQPINTVSINCIAEAKPVDNITAADSTKYLVNTHDQFYVEEENQLTLTAKTGYIFSNSVPTITNATNVTKISLSGDGKTLTISFKPTPAAATSGCVITCNTTIKTYTVTYNVTNCHVYESEITTQTVQEGGSAQTVDFEPDFGYYFDYDGDTYPTITKSGNANITITGTEDKYWGSTVSVDISNVQQNITVNVVASGAEFTVHYLSPEGGSVPTDVKKTYSSTSKTIPLSAATRTDYDQQSWSTTQSGEGTTYAINGTVPINSTTFPSAANRTLNLYAIWTIKHYTITVNLTHLENSEGTTSSTYDVTAGASATVDSLVPDFGYYMPFTDDGYAGISYTGTATLTPTTSSDRHWFESIGFTVGNVHSDVTVTVTATAATFYISYSPNTGTGSIAPITFVYGEAVTLSDGTGISKTGYTLQQWNTKANGTGAAYDKGASYQAKLTDFSTSTSMILYAQWDGRVYNITTTGTHCTINAPLSIKYGETATVTITAEDGYTLPNSVG